MKRIIFYVGLMCLLAGWCPSCSNDKEEGIGDNIPILLSALSTDGLHVKSTITDNQPLLQNMEAGVYINEDGGTNASIGSNLHYKVNASGGLNLQGGSQPYYPSSGRSVKISAYYPYSSDTADLFDFSIESNQSTDADYNASDLLYSTETSYTRQSTAHSLPFKHKLSRITYSLIAGDGAPPLTGGATVGVSIMNVLPTAEFDRITGTIGVAKGIATNVIPHANGTIVVPQTIACGTRLIKVVADNNDYYYKPTSPLVLESGKSYDFRITLQGTELQATYTVMDWTNGTVDDNGGIVAAYTYRVGDYYPDPNVDLSNPVEKVKIKGIVYWLDPASNGKHGRVVGLKETTGRWGVYGKDESPDVTGIRSFTDGKTATRNLIAARKDATNFTTDYFIFNWIYQTMNSGIVDGVWYLPAMDELSVLYSTYNTNRGDFNDRLNAAGGDGLGDYYYWSSSEGDGTSTWGVSFAAGSTFYGNKSFGSNSARCVLVF